MTKEAFLKSGLKWENAKIIRTKFGAPVHFRNLHREENKSE